MQEHFYIEDGILTRYDGTENTVFIPETVHTIGPNVFRGKAWLTEVHLPSGLRSIGAEAFKGCGKLGNMVFPEGLTSIGEHAFQRCKAMTEILLPDSLTQVERCAFRDCINLEAVRIQGLTHFPKELFAGDIRLTKLELHARVRTPSLKDGVLDGCLALRQITVSDGSVYHFDSVTAALNHPAQLVRDVAKAVLHPFVIKDGELRGYTGNQKEILLPDVITALGSSCLAWRKNITSVTCPPALRAIGTQALAGCTALETVKIHRAGVAVADNAFYQCQTPNIVYAERIYTLEQAFREGVLIHDPDGVLKDFYLSGKRLLKYWGDSSTVVIPQSVEVIDEGCFENKLRLQTVHLTPSVKRIGSKAFRNCRNLKNVYYDGTPVTAEDAFEGCEKLKTAMPCGQPVQEPLTKSIPEAGVEPYAFCNRDDLTQLHLKDVAYIGDYAFAHCKNLETLVIDAPECTIARRAFTLCSSLKQIHIRAKHIEKGAFAHCHNLEEAKIEGVQALGEEVFAGCQNLRQVKLSDTVSIGKRCFDDCASLCDFDFVGIRRIGERAFERCDGLKCVRLSDTEVARQAFADCAALETIEFTSATNFDAASFFGCTQVKEICFDGSPYPVRVFADGMNYVSNPLPLEVREIISGIHSCFDISRHFAIERYLGNASVCAIPDGITEIGSDAFRNAVRLKSVQIPASVKTFGKHPFEGTPWLKEKRKEGLVIRNRNLIDGRNSAGQVVIPGFVQTVCQLAFDENTRITGLVLESKDTRVEPSAFRNCFRLKRITTPDRTEYVYQNDLSEYPEHIREIFLDCTEVFEMDAEGTLLRANGNIAAQYLPAGVRTLSEGVYRGSHRLEQLTLTPDTEIIEKEAFFDCKWLRKISGAGGIRRIGDSAFDGCRYLEEIDLSENLAVLGEGSFRHCCSLREITLSGSIQAIPAQAFFRCKSLKRIVLPPSLQKIGPEAFALCTELEEVVFPGSQADIEIHSTAFAWCEKLQEVTYAL